MNEPTALGFIGLGVMGGRMCRNLAEKSGKPVAGGGGDGSEAIPEENLIRAPMVGTFYMSPSPESEPFVEVGDSVEEGQTLCIIEAMKVMNEVKAERSGTIEGILVENSEPVEYGTPLFRIS